MKMKCNVKVVDFGAVKALVSVEYGDIVIRGFRVMDKEGSEPWVAMPCREFVKDQERQYMDIVFLPDAKKRDEFTAKILKEYKNALSD